MVVRTVRLLLVVQRVRDLLRGDMVPLHNIRTEQDAIGELGQVWCAGSGWRELLWQGLLVLLPALLGLLLGMGTICEWCRARQDD